METTLTAQTAQDLSALSDEELSSLADMIGAEIAARKQPRDKTIAVSLETASWFDSRKHGHAYVAFLKNEGGKVQRIFIEGGTREWDTKKKTYRRSWEFDAPVGSVLECRLTDGSWKNDYRQWFHVTEEGWESVSQSRAMELAKGD